MATLAECAFIGILSAVFTITLCLFIATDCIYKVVCIPMKVCASRYWFNYRHVANTLSIYRSVKRLGIPDRYMTSLWLPPAAAAAACSRCVTAIIALCGCHQQQHAVAV